MGNLINRLTDLEGEAQDLIQMARLTQTVFNQLTISDSPKKPGVIPREFEPLNFAITDLRSRAEILNETIGALIEQLEDPNG